MQEEVDAMVEAEVEARVLATVEDVVDELGNVVVLEIEVEELDAIEVKLELIVETDEVKLAD